MGNNSLYVHCDINLLSSFYRIPRCRLIPNDVYIMQEDRIVFLGSIISAELFLITNNNKYCKEIYEKIIL